MNISTGVDIIETERIEKAINRNSKFINEIYTSKEIEYCENKGKEKYKSYAVRFAAKEAYVKALGTGFSSKNIPKQIEILNNKEGKPFIYIDGKKKDNCELSMSHSKFYAVAYVLIVKEDK